MLAYRSDSSFSDSKYRTSGHWPLSGVQIYMAAHLIQQMTHVDGSRHYQTVPNAALLVACAVYGAPKVAGTQL